jgi:hypothetical protein
VEVRFKLIYSFNHFYLSSLWLHQWERYSVWTNCTSDARFEVFTVV